MQGNTCTRKFVEALILYMQQLVCLFVGLSDIPSEIWTYPLHTINTKTKLYRKDYHRSGNFHVGKFSRFFSCKNIFVV